MEAVAILVRFFGIATSVDESVLTSDVVLGSWYDKYASFALENELLEISAGNLTPHSPITRAESAHLVVEIARIAAEM